MMEQWIRQVPAYVKSANPNAPQEVQTRAIQEILSVTRESFGESYRTAMQRINEDFGNLGRQSELVATYLSALAQPSNDLSGVFPNLNTGASRATTAVGNLAGATESAANRIGNLQINPPAFSPFGVPVTGQPGITVPGHARGGIVEGDGFAYLHRGNAIFPAKTTQGIRGVNRIFDALDKRDEPRSVLPNISRAMDADSVRSDETLQDLDLASLMSGGGRGERSESGGSFTVQYSPAHNITISGNSGVSREEIQQILAEHDAKSQEILKRKIENHMARVVRKSNAQA